MLAVIFFDKHCFGETLLVKQVANVVAHLSNHIQGQVEFLGSLPGLQKYDFDAIRAQT